MRVAVLYENSVHMQDAIFFLKKNYMQDEIKCFNSTFALATFICDEVKGDVDLLIVCIKSSKDEAIVFAKDMQSFFPHMKLIFFSQTNDCAEEIFDANPTYFVKLPYKAETVMRGMEKIRLLVEDEREQVLNLMSRGQLQKIRFSNIKYVECIGRKLYIYTQDNVKEVNMTIGELMEKLPENFVQCHRSYIVNLDKVLIWSSDELELVTKELIPIARPRQKEIKEIISKYK